MAQETFDLNFCPDAYRASKNNTEIKKLTNHYESAYLKKVVNKGTHKWRFKINKKTSAIIIGVWKCKYRRETILDLYASASKGKYYGWDINFKHTTPGDGNNHKEYGDRNAKDGDIIDIILDLDKFELTYNLNEKSQGIAFTNIEKGSYCVGVCIYDKNNSVQLSSYEGGEDPESRDDIKCAECDKFKSENKKLKQESRQKIDELQSELSLKDAIVNSLKDEIQSSIKEKDALNQQMQELRQENQKKEQEHQQYKTKMERKYKQINDANIKLNEECKEYQSNLQEMTQKYNQLLRKSKINEQDYEEWNHELVCDWIISLDQEYEKYEQKLRIKAKEQEIDGTVLGDLDKGDLLNLGISPIKHRIAIMKNIKRIISAKSQQVAIPQMNEGNNVAPTAYI